MKPIPLAATAALLAALGSCRAEGNSFYLGEGPAEYFLTMARCRREATSAFPEGGSRYSGYRCVEKLLWFTLLKEEYENGKASSRIQ